MAKGIEHFQGALDSIDPIKLIDPQHSDKLDNFFLVLASVYNDIKGLMIFHRTMDAVYEPPGTDVSVHNGESSGVMQHLFRITLSTIHEFFSFLEANRTLIESQDFQKFIQKLPSQPKKDFKDIIAVAFNPKGSKDKKSFAHTLMLMRNHVGFHYDDKGLNLRAGFLNFFTNRPKDVFNERAYYSLGIDMSTSRFFYADAAIQQHLTDLSPRQTLDFNKEVRDAVSKLNRSIYHLLRLYINDKQTTH